MALRCLSDVERLRLKILLFITVSGGTGPVIGGASIVGWYVCVGLGGTRPWLGFMSGGR
jgi:hypothetical protein